MRNFKDLSRALASIAGGLKSIKDIIDTIEPGGGGGSVTSYKVNEEREIGVWTDGTTPVYEYAVSISGSGSNDWQTIDMSSTPVASADNIFIHYGYIVSGGTSMQLQFYANSTYAGYCEYHVSDKELAYKITSGYSSYTGLIVLRYTKSVS